jgi:hypothetical protein
MNGWVFSILCLVLVQIFLVAVWLDNYDPVVCHQSLLSDPKIAERNFAITEPKVKDKVDGFDEAGVYRQSKCLCPNKDLGGFKPRDIHQAVTLRKKWSMELFPMIETDLDRYHQTGENVLNGHATKDRNSRFNFLGPVAPQCKKLEAFGTGDEEKRACGLKEQLSTSPSCTIISLGSNNQWAFEEAIFRDLPNCQIHTFDCTVPQGSAPPAPIASRTTLHRVCIGSTDTTANGLPFMSWKSIMKMLHQKSPPEYLKMDIEGYEFEVLRAILVDDYLPPQQVAMELHYLTHVPVTWQKRGKTSAEIALFMQHLNERGGYFLVDRHDNPSCPHCSEILISRLLCPCTDR